jgi:predicted ATPase
MTKALETPIETTKERWAEAEINRMRGTLLQSMHEKAVDEDSYHRALEVARQQQAKSWELRAAMNLARLWRDQGNGQQARELRCTGGLRRVLTRAI